MEPDDRCVRAVSLASFNFAVSTVHGTNSRWASCRQVEEENEKEDGQARFVLSGENWPVFLYNRHMVDPLGEKTRLPILTVLRYAVSICAALLSIALCAYLVFLSCSPGSFGTSNDFPQYHGTARLISQGRASEVYDTASLMLVERTLHPSLQRPLALFVPPPAALFFAPIALIPPSLAFYAWIGLLVSALLASLYLLKREFFVPAVGAGWLVAAVFAFGPTFEALRISQPATLMLFALCCSYAFFLQKKPFVAGAILGLLLLKPQELLPLGIFFLACRQWKLIGGLAAVTIVMTVISLLVFGVPGYQNYIHLILDPASADLMQSVINPTVRGQLGLVFGIDAPVTKYGAMAAAVLAFVGCLLVGHKARTTANPYYAALVVAVPVGLVTAWHCHDYDIVLSIPGFVGLFMAANRRRQAFITLPIIVGTLIYMIPVYAPLHYFYLLQGGLVNPYFLLLLAFAAGTLFSFLTGKLPGLVDEALATEASSAEA